jgi:hypothetical protein
MSDTELLLEEWGGMEELVLRNLEPKDSGTISCIVSTDIDTVRYAVHCPTFFKALLRNVYIFDIYVKFCVFRYP